MYPAPSYWVTDWIVAGYVADRYAASISAAQAHEEARLARIEAEQARLAAEKARDDAEIAEAKAAQAQAELRSRNAEDRAARAERDLLSSGPESGASARRMGGRGPRLLVQEPDAGSRQSDPECF